VSPSVRIGTDECSQIAAGDGWVATVDLRLALASFYDRNGRALGTRPLAPARRSGEQLTAFTGAGHHLAVGTNTGTVYTLHVGIDPTCRPPHSAN
jgi:hypothetical protein